jgi:hypothetical protein
VKGSRSNKMSRVSEKRKWDVYEMIN